MPVEPGLNAIAHMSRTIDLRILIMGDTVLLSPDVAHQIGPPFQSLDLTDHRDESRFSRRLGGPDVRAQCSRDDPHTQIFL